MMREAGSPIFSRSSRVIPFVTFFKSSAVTCGGGGGGGGGGGTISGSGSGAGAFATARRPAGGGGGGTDSLPPPLPPSTDAFGAPGPTSSSGAAFELSSGDFAAFAVVLSTLPKIAVIPSLTFFPAALPMALPAADAPTSVIVWAPATAANRTGITNKIRRMQYLIWQRNIPRGGGKRAKHLMRPSKSSKHHMVVGLWCIIGLG
jgi:hypothetical protein